MPFKAYKLIRNRNSTMKPSRGSIADFVVQNSTVWLALVAGLALITATIVFSEWIGKQIPLCPGWALECDVSSRVALIRNNYAVVQGLVTAVYVIGMTALAYTAHAFSESAVWPLLAKRSMTVKQLGTYLEASRGSVLSSPLALYKARNAASAAVLLCTVAITLLPLSGAPLVGYVYQRQNVSVAFQSSYEPGGGIGPVFRQRNPPSSIRDSAASHYTSWSRGLSREPLQEYREWFVDRNILGQRGNMTVVATKFNRNITCRPWQLPKPKLKGNDLYFKTEMRDSNKGHNDSVQILRLPALTVWADSYDFPSPKRTISTLIFAVLNGDINGGFTSTDLPEQEQNKKFIKKISAIACDIDLELVEDVLTIGEVKDDTLPVHINTLADIKITFSKDHEEEYWDPLNHPENTLNELILWFTVAPITNGASFWGAQPIYEAGKALPTRSTSTGVGNRNDGWNIPYIKNFIEASIGASILGDSGNFKRDVPRRIFTSYYHILKLQSSRCRLLLMPPVILLINGVVLLILNIYLHHKLRISIMRLAPLSEILKSAQTDDLSRQAANDMLYPRQRSKLDTVSVQFVESSSGVWGLTCRDDDAGLLGARELLERTSVPGSTATLEYQGVQS